MPEATIADPAVISRTVAIGLPALAKLVFHNIDLTELRRDLTARRAAAASPGVLLDLATLETVLGNAAEGQRIQGEALAGSRVFFRPVGSDPPGPASGRRRVRLLVVMASGPLMANTPVEFLLEASDIAIAMVFCRPGETLPDTLPAHDAVFVAIGESDEHRETLAVLAAQLADWPVPVINRPEAIARLGRADVVATLRDCSGLLAPALRRVERQDFLATARNFPGGAASAPGVDRMPTLLARPVDSHAGTGLERLTSPEAAERYLREHDNQTFYLGAFIDYADTQGIFQKYRIAFIDGVPYPSHMAISKHWMIHYLNAGMDKDAEKRAEEARWMAGFDIFHARHRDALATLVDRIGLDYFVIDCGETPAGDLLVFEVDGAMLVHAMDHPDLFAYKQQPMRRLFGAVQDMITRKAFPSLDSATRGTDSRVC